MLWIKKHLAAFISAAGLLFLCIACATTTPLPAPADKEPAPDPATRVFLRSEPSEKPDWIDNPPRGEEELFFVGTSRLYSTAADARGAARENAFNQVVKFYGEFIQSSATEKSSFAGASSETINALVSREEEISNFAQAVVSQIGTDRYYTEIYLNPQNQEEYLVYTLCQIPRQKAEEDIRNFAKNTSEAYTNLLTTQNTLYAALRMYSGILSPLENNPLHRAVSYYDSPNGRVNLYEYLSLQINALANSAAFNSIPAGTIQKTDTLDITVRISSPQAENIGPVDCLVSIYGKNNPSPTVKYPVALDNTISLKILTLNLEPGTYTARLELLMNELSPRIQKNPTAGFSFEIIPAAVSAEFRGVDLSETQKNTLLQGLQRGIQNNTIPVRFSAPPENVQNRYSFVITVDTTQSQTSSVNMALVFCDVSIAFLRNGAVLHQSEKKRFTEPVANLDRALSQAANFIRDNSGFLAGVKESLTR